MLLFLGLWGAPLGTLRHMLLGRFPRWNYYEQRGIRALSRVSRAGNAVFTAFPALDPLNTARDLEDPAPSSLGIHPVSRAGNGVKPA